MQYIRFCNDDFLLFLFVRVPANPIIVVAMKIYLVSVAAGTLVGLIYSLLGVRSPAPPLVALVGLLGILIGEQVIPVGRHLLAHRSLAMAWNQVIASDHLFGALPGHNSKSQTSTLGGKQT